MGQQLQKISFPESKLLENYTRFDHEIIPNLSRVNLINDNVKIILDILPDKKESDKKEILLIAYYNMANTKGIARCSLFAILKKLLEDDDVNLETMVTVDSVGVTPKNLKRKIKLYKEIGFERGSPIPGNNINLRASVKDLIEKLEQQCEMTGGGKKYRKSKSKRLKSKKRKSKKRKTKRRRKSK